MLGATYENFEGKVFTTISQHDAILLRDGDALGRFVAQDHDYITGRTFSRDWEVPSWKSRSDLE